MGLRKRKWPWEVWPGKLCSPVLPRDGGNRQDTGPLQLRPQHREPAKGCQSSHAPRCHARFNCQTLRLSCVTQCPSRLANTSSPDLIFPEIWLMLALPPKKGCQGRVEIENMISLVRTGREPNTMMQQEGREAQPAWFPLFLGKGRTNSNADFDCLALCPPPFVRNTKITVGAAGREISLQVH